MRRFKSVLCLIPLLVFAMASTPTASDVAAAQGDPLPTLAPMLARVTPAVVNISVLTRGPAEDNPLFQDPFFRRYFGLPAESQQQLSAGSGVIVDAARGHILTNHHIVANAREIVITLKDSRRLSAELIGSDPATDIALVKIEARDLVALPLADSDELRVGDYVVAIGNPFGLGETITSGLVGALRHPAVSIEGYEGFIQTGASINPGNSGGALVNLQGQLVGVNTANIAPGGGNVGIGFAVPSNMVRAVVEKLTNIGEVQRSPLGVTIQDVTPDLAEALALKDASGVLVIELVKGSQAERVGIRSGDLITALDGQPVSGAAELGAKVGLGKAGEPVVLTVVRNGRSMPIRARVEAPKNAAKGPARIIPSRSPIVGAVLQDRPSGNGVGVESVEQGGQAWRDGLRAGDIITSVNRRPVRDTLELTAKLTSAENTLVLEVLRGDQTIIVIVRG